MKRVSFLLLALLVAIPSFTQTIYLDKFADKSVLVEFNKLQKITFDNDNLYIEKKVTDIINLIHNGKQEHEYKPIIIEKEQE